MDYISTQVRAAMTSVYNNISGMPACADRKELINQFVEYADKLKTMQNEPEECNTQFEYLYRDAGNWKSWNCVVLKGAMTPQMYREIQKCCEDGCEMFIPEQVGLPLIREWEVTEDDHPYAELGDYSLVPNKPDTDMTPEELLERFRKAKDNWHPEEYQPEPDYYDSEEDED